MIKAKFKGGSDTGGKIRQPKLNDFQNQCPRLLSKGFPLLWFAIAAFVLFGQSINFNYTYLDDQTLILNNLDKLKSASYLSTVFSEDVFHSPTHYGYYYRPMLTLSFMADAMIGNGNFAMFHFSNIVYHILATFLLFMFLIEMGYDRIRSFLFTLLFLVHPMVTQAVAWVPGRNDTLLAIFTIGSFLFWLKFLKSGKNRYVMLHLLCYVLALLTKENTVVLPVLIILYSTMLLRTPLKKKQFLTDFTPDPSSERRGGQIFPGYVIAGAGWVFIIFIWAAVRYQVLHIATGVPFSAQILSIIKNLPAVLPFLGKALFPFNLAVYPILADLKVSTILGIIAIVVLAFLIWITRPKRWADYFFGVIWFLAFLFPTFVTINNQIPNFSEHRSYLSLAGILFIIMACDPVKKATFSRLVPVSAMAGLCLVFSILTFYHSRYFRDQFIFWQNAVDTSPSHAFNYNNLGAMYFLAGDMEKAEPMFRKSLAINPYEPMANSNTGLVCMRTDRPAEAEKYYLEEIRINPTYDHVYYNLGLLYYNHSRYEEGIRQWEKTLTINPVYIDAYKALLFAYEKLERREDYERIVIKAKENGVMP